MKFWEMSPRRGTETVRSVRLGGGREMMKEQDPSSSSWVGYAAVVPKEGRAMGESEQLRFTH